MGAHSIHSTRDRNSYPPIAERTLLACTALACTSVTERARIFAIRHCITSGSVQTHICGTTRKTSYRDDNTEQRTKKPKKGRKEGRQTRIIGRNNGIVLAAIDLLPPQPCRQLAWIIIGSPFYMRQHQQIVGQRVGQHVGRAVPIIYVVGTELYGLLPGAQMQESMSGQVQEQGRKDRRGQGGVLQVLQGAGSLRLFAPWVVRRGVA